MPEQPAAGPWRTDEPPRDGAWIVGFWSGDLFVARWMCIQWDRIRGATYGWADNGMWQCEHGPDVWAPINMPEEDKA